jgi:hypothetical protein
MLVIQPGESTSIVVQSTQISLVNYIDFHPLSPANNLLVLFHKNFCTTGQGDGRKIWIYIKQSSSSNLFLCEAISNNLEYV